jgi:hypothetical protein
MLEPADIAVEEGAQVIHAVLEHRQAIDSAAEGEALPFLGIESMNPSLPPTVRLPLTSV